MNRKLDKWDLPHRWRGVMRILVGKTRGKQRICRGNGSQVWAGSLVAMMVISGVGKVCGELHAPCYNCEFHNMMQGDQPQQPHHPHLHPQQQQQPLHPLQHDQPQVKYEMNVITGLAQVQYEQMHYCSTSTFFIA